MAQLVWAALAGVLGACAGAALKAAFQPPVLLGSLIILRALCAAAGVAANAAMVWAFARALQASGSPAATLTSAAANVVASAALGTAIFGERLGRNWALGTGLLLVGLLLMHRGMRAGAQDDKKKA